MADTETEADTVLDRLVRLEQKAEALDDDKAGERDCMGRHVRTNAALNDVRTKMNGSYDHKIPLTNIDIRSSPAAAIEARSKLETVAALAIVAAVSSIATALVLHWLGG